MIVPGGRVRDAHHATLAGGNHDQRFPALPCELVFRWFQMGIFRTPVSSSGGVGPGDGTAIGFSHTVPSS